MSYLLSSPFPLLGVTVGFATCLWFVFLTIPAAITAKLWYGVSLADSDWLHGSAESLLTVTNLVTVIAFRQALDAMEQVGTDFVVVLCFFSLFNWSLTWTRNISNLRPFIKG